MLGWALAAVQAIALTLLPAGQLLQPVLAASVLVLGLLLALAVSLRRSSALAPGKPAREMLFCVALGVALLLPHLWDEQRLRGVLKLVQPYLLLPGAVLILCLLPGAVLCKRRRKP